MPDIDEMVLDWVASDAFRGLLTTTIRATYPPHEWDRFDAHFGGLIDLWIKDETNRLG